MPRAEPRPWGVSASDLVTYGWQVPDLLTRSPVKIAWHPDLDMQAIVAFYAKPHTFFNTCQGVRMDDSTGYFTATPKQRRVLQFIHDNLWGAIGKGRQGMVTSAVALGVLLRDCQYLEGMQGVLIANTRETAEMVFERIVFAYEKEDVSVRMPLARGKRPATRHIKFAHGGGIAVLTMGSKAPAVGRSVGRLHITEFGEAQWQEVAATKMFPTIEKRPNAMVILEGTPGLAGSHYEKMWRNAQVGRGRFAALFLPWFEEPENCAKGVWGEDRDRLGAMTQEGLAQEEGLDPIDTVARAAFQTMTPTMREAVWAQVLTEEERAYFADVSAASLLHVLFRRMALDTEFGGDPRLFSSQYPKDPYDGWLGSKHPVMPHDAVRSRLSKAKPDGAFPLGPSGCLEIHPPEPKASYLLTGDPAHYGEVGDPSALAVWRVRGELLQLAAFWLGREDPGRFAARVQAAQERYSTRLQQNEPTTVAIESNAMGTIQALLDRGMDGLFWCERAKPGWYATDVRILRAESRAVDLLRKGHAEIGSESMLQQLLDYDGSKRGKRGRTVGGVRHHFDLARCFIIAADVMRSVSFPDASEEKKEADTIEVAAVRPGVTWKMYDQDRKERAGARQSALGPSLYALPQGLYE